MATVSNFNPLNPTRTAISMPSSTCWKESRRVKALNRRDSSHPVQASVVERLRLLRQQDAVGSQGEVLDPGIAPEHAHQSRQVLAQQGLAAGQAHLVHAELREDAGQRVDLLEREDGLARQPGVLLLRHAVLAAQVAPVRDRNAQAAERPAEGVGDGRHLAAERERAHGCSSTQTSPCGVLSSFPMGVICLSSSMLHLQARNASARCSAAAMTSTMFSPTWMSPYRWTMRISITSKSFRARSRISRSFFWAIPS